ncbi:hypothetical protein [Streptomyces sp. VNUA24]|nr:hypothetical protein [Streptomyces sp. VNUA24]WEH13883.1 hypothetical protein PYR72_09260 [Streptomyces sp. VNUA24]
MTRWGFRVIEDGVGPVTVSGFPAGSGAADPGFAAPVATGRGGSRSGVG